jgi:hypothetical protein
MIGYKAAYCLNFENVVWFPEMDPSKKDTVAPI